MKLFIGSFCLLLLAGLSVLMLGEIQEVTFSPAVLVVILGLIFFVRKKGFDLLFKSFFLLNTCVLLLFAGLDFLGVPYRGHFSSFWLHFSIVVHPLLAFGFINQHYTFKRAALEYPLLWQGMMLPVFINLVFYVQNSACILLICAFWSLSTLLLYLALSRAKLGPSEEGQKVPVIYIVSLAVLPFSLRFLSMFPLGVFGLLGSQALFFSSALLLTVPIGVFVSERGMKALVISTLILIIGTILFGVALFGSVVAFLGFCTLGAAFTMIKELFLLLIEKKDRFSVKLLVDGIVLSFVSISVKSVQKFILHQEGALSAISTSYIAIFLLFAILALLSLKGLYRATLSK